MLLYAHLFEFDRLNGSSNLRKSGDEMKDEMP